MNKKLMYIIAGIICLTLSLSWSFHSEEVEHSGTFNKQISALTASALSKAVPKITVSASKTPIKKAQAITKPVSTKKDTIKKINHMNLNKVSFDDLPGWGDVDVKKSLEAFQVSCKTFLKQQPGNRVGSHHINMRAKDWHPACIASLAVDPESETEIKAFFEKWFRPIEFAEGKPVRGLFTGYYMPQLNGSLTKTDKYNIPIYGLPKNLKWGHYTREQIDNGVLNKKAPVIAWIDSPVERLFLEIEGAGVIKLTDGKLLYVGYAGENGAPYTSIGSILIKQGVMNKDNASKQAIKNYLESHPKSMNRLMHKNKSFVFFEDLKQPAALGAQGMTLTPGYSMAIDRKWIPLGAPLWLTATRPDKRTDNEVKFKRLMIAQDTGGAIRGAIRGDVYWGSGKKATFLGEHMKTIGRYWLLLPKHIISRIG